MVGALSLLALKVADSIQERQNAAEDSVAEVFDHLQRQTFVYARMVADNSQIRRGVHFINTAMILKYIQPVQAQIKVDTITVHNSASIILAQSHEPTSFNITDKDNPEIRKSVKGLSHSTIDFSSRPISVKTSIPVYHENDDSLIVGTVTVGYSINAKFAGDIRRISGVDVLFVLKREILTTSFPKLRTRSLENNQEQLKYRNTTYDISSIPIRNNSHKELSLAVAVNNFASKVTLWMIWLSIPLLVAFVYRERNQAIQREKSRNQAVALDTQRRAAVRLQAEVDERKKAQAELEVALDLAQTANRLKDEFLANVSHELRTPLNSLMNVPTTLLEDFQSQEVLYCPQCDEGFMPGTEEGEAAIPEPCPDCGVLLEVRQQLAFAGSPETHSHYLQLAERNSKKLLHVVESLLYSSEIDAGRVELETDEANVEEILNQILKETTTIAQAKSIHLQSELAVTHRTAQLDSKKIEHVLNILVDNAIKFSESGATVLLRVKQLSNDSNAPHAFEFSVSDTGQGIPSEELPTLFDKFRQVDGSHTRREQGLGLGLAIAKGLIDIHGGTFTVESELGQGSTFTFRVPTDSKPEEGTLS